ncbi:MAG: rhodanese-like domain-containing protein [Coriobacteriia bacterium]|jgi:rhodanese-related sulfurtransferase|nr:rhodanese-like domain-containing protein [Coriobacteriia bacterium]
MDTKKMLIWGAVAVVAVIALVMLLRPAGSGVKDVSPERAAQIVADGVRVIDVRTQAEYEMGAIPGAENVPMDQLAAASANWDPAEPLLIYCTTGARSTQAVHYLEQQGFKTVYHLAAGLVAWQGDLEHGSEVAPMPAEGEPTNTPVMYEFFTDW